MAVSVIARVPPTKVFDLLNRAKSSRRIILLLGSGCSVDAGIPTSAFLADYIVAVWALAREQGWRDYRDFLRREGWPHRHDVWADWLLMQRTHDRVLLTQRFTELRNELYRLSLQSEVRRISPLYAQMAAKHFEQLTTGKTRVTDYRSLLASITGNDDKLVDMFFDHFIRGRQPSTTHQFVAFVTQLLNIKLILTTNFDPLIETALRNEGLSPTAYDVPRDGSVPTALLVNNQSLSVIKLHGGSHSLRAGYDLDERLPIVTLDELRAYLGGDGSTFATQQHPVPLLLVLGYSGSDHRVMDVVADHIATWGLRARRSDCDIPLVVWISRTGDVPEYLGDAVKAAPLITMSSARDGTRPIGTDRYAVLCEYKSAHLFFQELHQFITRQHAVSRTGYRAIASLPHSPVIPATLAQHTGAALKDSSNFGIYCANQQGLGTSTALASRCREFESTHEIISIDAADFSSRATLISQIQEEFVRFDRGLHFVSRPPLFRDGDHLRCWRAHFDGDPNLNADEDQWEIKVAARWITHALRRGNYVLAIDSLGEFARPHSSIPENHRPRNLIERQQRGLRHFIGELCVQAKKYGLGRSVILLALTPMGYEPQSGELDEQLDELTQGNRTECEMSLPLNTIDQDVRVAAPKRHLLAADKVDLLLAADPTKANGNVKRAAGLLVAIASLFRRPRSRAALLVTFVRYVSHVRQLHEDDKLAPDDINLYRFVSDIWKPASSNAQKPRQHERAPGFPCKEDQLSLAARALDYVVENVKLNSPEQWPLLSPLEGGFYWMHFESRDAIYRRSIGGSTKAPQTPSGENFSDRLIPPVLLPWLFDDIANFAIKDVYSRCQDAWVFIEYLHYRMLSIHYFAKLAEHPTTEVDRKRYRKAWRDRLAWLIGAIESDSDNLLARGKLPALVDQLRHLIELIVTLDKENVEFRVELHHLGGRLFARCADLMVASGHSRDALFYRLWQARIILDQSKQSLGEYREGPLTDNETLRTVFDCVQLARNANDVERVIDVVDTVSRELLADLDVPVNELIDRIQVAVEIAELLAERIVLDEQTLRVLRVKSRRQNSPWPRMERGKSIKDDKGNRLAKDRNERLIKALTILALCEGKLAEAEEKVRGTQAKDSAAMLARLAEIRASACARRVHFELNDALSRYRFGWLSNDRGFCVEALTNPEEKDYLERLAQECNDKADLLRFGPSTSNGQRIESRLHALRGIALSHLQRFHEAEVSFRRSQSVLRRPPAAGEKFTAAFALLAAAECELMRVGREFTLSSEVACAETIEKLQGAKIYLDQAEPLLFDSRSENRWRVFYCYLRATWHMAHAKWSQNADAAQETTIVRKDIRHALHQALAALTSIGQRSDRTIILNRLFDYIDAEGKKDSTFGNFAWGIERKRCGISESAPLTMNVTSRESSRKDQPSKRSSTQEVPKVGDPKSPETDVTTKKTSGRSHDRKTPRGRASPSKSSSGKKGTMSRRKTAAVRKTAMARPKVKGETRRAVPKK
jgi:hypothetical protein